MITTEQARGVIHSWLCWRLLVWNRGVVRLNIKLYEGRAIRAAQRGDRPAILEAIDEQRACYVRLAEIESDMRELAS